MSFLELIKKNITFYPRFFFSMGYNGRACILRALCESSQIFHKKSTNMVEELVRTIFTLPSMKVLPFEHADLMVYDKGNLPFFSLQVFFLKTVRHKNICFGFLFHFNVVCFAKIYSSSQGKRQSLLWNRLSRLQFFIN